MRSEEQLARLLRMVPFLSSNPGVTTDEVAEAFGVTPRQVLKDLDVLQFCGLPGYLYDDLFDVDVEAVRETGTIHFRNADVLARPLRLRPAEAASLLTALRLVVDVAGESEAATSALAKLEAAVGGESALSVNVSASDPALRARLADAIARRVPVRLTYRSSNRPGESVADVEPARLRLVDGFNYLDAWSRPREAWRSFRLDRIADVELLDGDTNADHGDAPEGWFDDVSDELTLTVAPSARWITEYYPTTAVVDHGDRLEVTFPVASLDWAVSLVLRLGDAVVDVSDPSIRAAAQNKAAQTLALYGA